MNKDIKELIDVSIKDGIITDKEREAILEKAIAMGENPKEVEIYIDAAQQEADMSNDAAIRKAKGKNCPFCGGIVPQLTDKCPHCHETITPEASAELQEILDNLEDALIDLKAGNDVAKSKAFVERFARKAKLYYSNNPKIAKLLPEIEEETLRAEQAAKDKILEQKKAVKNKKRNKTLIYVLLSLLVLAGAGTWFYFRLKEKDEQKQEELNKKYAHDPQLCVQAINEAIKNGDLLKAESIYTSYYNENNDILDYDGLLAVDPALDNLCRAYIEKGDLKKALALIPKLNENEDELRYTVIQKYVELGQYEEADNCGENFNFEPTKYFDFVCSCIDHMKEKGETSKIKSFIDRKAPRFKSMLYDESDPEWQVAPVKKRLYEYAGI